MSVKNNTERRKNMKRLLFILLLFVNLQIVIKSDYVGLELKCLTAEAQHLTKEAGDNCQETDGLWYYYADLRLCRSEGAVVEGSYTYKCTYCGAIFYDSFERDKHQSTCGYNSQSYYYGHGSTPSGYTGGGGGGGGSSSTESGIGGGGSYRRLYDDEVPELHDISWKEDIELSGGRLDLEHVLTPEQFELAGKTHAYTTKYFPVQEPDICDYNNPNAVPHGVCVPSALALADMIRSEFTMSEFEYGEQVHQYVVWFLKFRGKEYPQWEHGPYDSEIEAFASEHNMTKISNPKDIIDAINQKKTVFACLKRGVNGNENQHAVIIVDYIGRIDSTTGVALGGYLCMDPHADKTLREDTGINSGTYIVYKYDQFVKDDFYINN